MTSYHRGVLARLFNGIGPRSITFSEAVFPYSKATFSALKMEDDPVMKMYEAQAIAIEKQEEIDRLNRKKDELEERLRRFEQRPAGWYSKKMIELKSLGISPTNSNINLEDGRKH